MFRPTAEGKDQGQKYQPNDHDDFEGGEPKFEFAEETDTEIVYAHYSDQEDCNPNSGIESTSRHPVLQH